MQQCILYMVTLNDYKASSVNVRNICGMKTKNKNKKQKKKNKCVTRLNSCSWSFLQYCMDSKIRRIWVGFILLKESVGIKCAMYDQHVEY